MAAEMILDAHHSPSGKFKGFIIEGELRTGKTVYAIKVMRDVFRALNPEIDKMEAYELAMQNLYFDVEPFIERITQKQREIKEMLPRIDWGMRIPVACLDDASIYVGADLYIRDLNLYSDFQNCMTTIGSAASAVIITAPTHEALTKCLREYYSYRVVQISEADVWERCAKIREWFRGGKSEKLKLRGVGTDEYTAHLPNEVYARYLKPRLEKGEIRTASRERVSAEPIKEVAAEVLRQTPPPKRGKMERKKHRKIPLYLPPKPIPQPRKPLSELRKKLGLS